MSKSAVIVLSDRTYKSLYKRNDSVSRGKFITQYFTRGTGNAEFLISSEFWQCVPGLNDFSNGHEHCYVL